jgi:hypothetical protein
MASSYKYVSGIRFKDGEGMFFTWDTIEAMEAHIEEMKKDIEKVYMKVKFTFSEGKSAPDLEILYCDND